jgi:hypothetical protein
MRLTVLDNNEEIVRLEGKGNIVLPVIIFMRNVTNIMQSQPSSRSSSKLGGGQFGLIIVFDKLLLYI